jgi:sec-independent protein translocase protein TatA
MVGTLLPLQFGIPGGPELLIILLIAVLLFGANKIPKLARSTGEAMGEFQKGREEVEQELSEMREGATKTETDETTTTFDDAGPSAEDTEIDDETEAEIEET